MVQLLKKLRAALKFRRVTLSVLRLHVLEWVMGFLAARGWRPRPMCAPLGIVIRSTERCFMRCVMCGQNRKGGRLQDVKRGDRQDVDSAALHALAKDISGWWLKPFVKFTGGEPLVRWDLLRPAVEELRNMGCVIKLNTNGVLLRNEEIAEGVVRSGIEYLSVSVDGDEETHCRIRGLSTAFADARRGVENVIGERKRLGATYPMVLISCVVSTWNQERLHALADVAREWRADWLNIQYLNFVSKARAEAAATEALSRFGVDAQPWKGFEIASLTRIDPALLSRTIADIRKRAPCPVSTMKIGGRGEKAIRRYHLTDEVIEEGLCHMPFVTAFVVPPGQLTFCIDYPYYFYGDLRREGLREAWFGEAAQRFRDELVDHYRTRGTNYPQCLRCNWPYNS